MLCFIRKLLIKKIMEYNRIYFLKTNFYIFFKKYLFVLNKVNVDIRKYKYP